VHPQRSLDAAHADLERLLAGPSLARQTTAQSAVLHAIAEQVQALCDHLAALADAAAAIAANHSLPAPQLPLDQPLPLAERIADALPNALVMAAAFVLMFLLWVHLQWPPMGLMGVLMAVVLIGIETMNDKPALQLGRRVAVGAAVGLVVTAPMYLLVLPRLTGFAELALVLFPFYYAIVYWFHALPPPRQMPFLGMGLMAILMLQLSPQQSYDAAAWLGSALSVLTGFVVALTLLAIFRGMTPQERLRRTLRNVLIRLGEANLVLDDRARPDFDHQLGGFEQRIRRAQQDLADVAPLAYDRHVRSNDPARVEALLNAVGSLLLRFRALQHSRARWRSTIDDGRVRTDLGKQFRAAYAQVLDAFREKLDHPQITPSLAALDAIHPCLQRELKRVDKLRRADTEEAVATTYMLSVIGHYVAVARALRDCAEPLEAIDWAAWRVPRF
ncbi:MAG: FUSC family protein, partial [Thiohalocapsa sp.]